jgi:hypothetical protein
VPDSSVAESGSRLYTFADWTIDGTPLPELPAFRSGGRHPNVLGPAVDVTYLVKDSDEAVPQLNRLSGEDAPDFEDGRVALLVCAFDWDLGCGALSARVELIGDRVLWKDLGWQADCDPQIDYLSPPLTVEFDRPHYEHTLRAARDRYGRRSDAARVRGARWG